MTKRNGNKAVAALMSEDTEVADLSTCGEDGPRLLASINSGRLVAASTGDPNSNGTNPGVGSDVSEFRYRRLFEAARDGILILDLDSGAIIDVNPFVIKLLCYSKKELLGRHLWQIGARKTSTLPRRPRSKLKTKAMCDTKTCRCKAVTERSRMWRSWRTVISKANIS